MTDTRDNGAPVEKPELDTEDIRRSLRYEMQEELGSEYISSYAEDLPAVYKDLLVTKFRAEFGVDPSASGKDVAKKVMHDFLEEYNKMKASPQLPQPEKNLKSEKQPQLTETAQKEEEKTEQEPKEESPEKKTKKYKSYAEEIVNLPEDAVFHHPREHYTKADMDLVRGFARMFLELENIPESKINDDPTIKDRWSNSKVGEKLAPLIPSL